VLPNACVGAFATVGAGTVVLRRVRPEATVFGVPAKEL
jgi:serine acetyltransferase